MTEHGTGTATRQDVQQELKPPSMYRVLMHNDDYTSMDFVVEVLCHVFRKPADTAVRIMLEIHHNGIGMCGTFPMDVAATKVDTVHAMAESRGYPLRCTMEPE